LLVLVLVAACSAKLFSTRVTEIHTSWVKRERAAGVVDFRVNFQHRNTDRVDEMFEAVSDHKNKETYGKYITTAELNRIINPSVQEKAPVFAWLNRFGCSYMDMGQHARVRCTVAQAESMLHTRLYFAANTKNTKLRSIKAFDGVVVPDELLSVLSPVHPVGGSLTVLEPPRSLGFVIRNDKKRQSGPVNVAVVPQTLELQYNINNLAVSTPFGVITQAVAEFGNDNSYLPSDLTAFSSGMAVNIEGKVTTHGPFNSNPPDAESTLDIQYIASTGRNGSSVFWVVSGWLHEWLGDLVSTGNPPEVSSISWGADERQEGAAYNEEVDQQFKALSLVGCTFLAASGDTGAAGAACRSSRYAFNPGYPATSPYVLSVGATMFTSYTSGNFNTPFCQQSSLPCVATGVEVPADVTQYSFSSGGGFSTYAPVPAWQKQAVQQYLNNPGITLPPASDFNRNNRAFPDVAAQGWNVVIMLSGQWTGIGGTSASSPIFAGMLSLLNDAQRKRGKPKLGFVNPLIYDMANSTGIFVRPGDTSDNNNNGCTYGYQASGSLSKFDPVVGLGTLRLQKALAWLIKNT